MSRNGFPGASSRARAPLEALAGGILLAVGFNPYRPHHRSRADYLFVAAAALACLALLVWAVLG
jgi:hypothetical protein